MSDDERAFRRVMASGTGRQRFDREVDKLLKRRAERSPSNGWASLLTSLFGWTTATAAEEKPPENPWAERRASAATQRTYTGASVGSGDNEQQDDVDIAERWSRPQRTAQHQWVPPRRRGSGAAAKSSSGSDSDGISSLSSAFSGGGDGNVEDDDVSDDDLVDADVFVKIVDTSVAALGYAWSAALSAGTFLGKVAGGAWAAWNGAAEQLPPTSTAAAAVAADVDDLTGRSRRGGTYGSQAELRRHHSYRSGGSSVAA
ncbi:hypothetical protein JKP88DRAFT_278134 [Tribonema minus]|uniref:Uncharacterized protein n=1 Tax=Tribonema minus TaxID=303371 RepID=A0A835YX30_9STRA|nr:hypothetical protein JKP88DRAFT_278134 [Tribonema minus]